jgi:hypothetical protein
MKDSVAKMSHAARVELNGRAEAFQAYDEGSIPFTRSRFVAKQVYRKRTSPL